MKKHIKKHITDLLKDESGQGTTEYILILVVVVALAFAFRGPIEGIVGGKMTEITDKLTQFIP